MRNFRHSLLWIVAFFFLIYTGFISSDARADKSYKITKVDIEAWLHSDGSMDVIESRTYAFKGSFSYAYRVIPEDDVIKFSDFKVLENGIPYKLTASRQEGTFAIIPMAGSVEIRWFFKAKNQSRTFDFGYKAKNAIQRFEDAAVLYYQFISQDWNLPSQNVNLRLHPPESAGKSQVREWLHGPLWAASRIEPDGSIIAWCEYLPRRKYFEIRAIYPPEIFKGAPMISRYVRESIMKEEARWAEISNQEREKIIQEEEARKERWSKGKWLMIILSLGGLFIWWKLYQKYGRRPDIPSVPRISSEIPQKIPPALVSYLIYGRNIYGGALVSSLLDLARRGFLRMREEEEEKRRFFGGRRKKTSYFWELNRDFFIKNEGEIQDYEKDLIRFIFDELGGGVDSIDLKQLQKQQSKFTKFFEKWKKRIKKEGDEQGWYDKPSLRGVGYSALVSGVMFLLTIGAIFLFGPWAAVLGGSTLLVFILSFFISHRTSKGEMLARQWKALKRYLSKYHYRESNTSSLLDRIDDYFVYGVVLGLTKKVFSEMAHLIPAERFTHYFPWYIYHGHGTPAVSADHFASAFSSMITSTTTAMSSAAGTGGGASTGGGGGASSGGGGAG